MLNALILMNLVFFTFEVDHCFDLETVCTKCISGYKLVNSPYGASCQKEEEFNNYNRDNIAHCLYSGNGQCQECEKGFAETTDGKCKDNTIHCSLFNGDTCIECESYYKLTEGKCEKSTCKSFDDDGECECEHGFYYNNKGGCSKIPIAYCEEGNATYCDKCERYYYVNDQGKCDKIPIQNCERGNKTYCDECRWKQEYKETSKECTLKEGEEDNASDGGNIANCQKVDKKDNTICGECSDNYDWDDDQKKCIYLCDGDTEKYCDECNENYNSYDYGKTCEKIDLEYTSPSDEEDGSKYMKLGLAILSALFS